MDILGIGPLELLFILIIALIILGPNDMVKAGKSLGKLLRSIVMSPSWRSIQQTSSELRNLPNRLIREAGLEELKDTDALNLDLNLKAEEWVKPVEINGNLLDWTTPPPPVDKPSPAPAPANPVGGDPPAETTETQTHDQP